jgi:ankyrin repeat protein
LAIATQNANEVRRLLDAGADQDSSLNVMLQDAAHLESTEIVELLIEAGVDIDHHDGDNWTALFGAAVDGPPSTVSLLLEKGSDPCRRTELNRPVNYAGMRAVDVAAARGNERVLSILEEATQHCE